MAQTKPASRSRKPAVASKVKSQSAATAGITDTAQMIQYLDSLKSKDVDWTQVLAAWMKIRPFSTGFSDLAFWVEYAAHSATGDHKNPPRGLIWM